MTIHYYDNGQAYPIDTSAPGEVRVLAVAGRPLPRAGGMFINDDNDTIFEPDASSTIRLATEHAKPEVGQAATLHIGSDCYPATVTGVSASGATIELMVMEVKASNLFVDTEQFIIARRSRRDGYYRSDRYLVSVGERRYYRDPSF